MHDTKPHLLNSDFPAIFRKPLEILQVNLGYLCNLSCVHCHVNAGPKRTELMSRVTIEQLLALAEAANIHTLDLTGGAPEMHPDFRYLVRAARNRGIVVIDRCNLTILEAPGYEDLAGFLAAQQVQITASLPCYLEENVDKQRGKGVFRDSLAALQRLNNAGLRPAGQRAATEFGFQPARCSTAARSAPTGTSIQTASPGPIRHRLQPSLRHRQYADPALRQHADQSGPVRQLSSLAERQFPRRQSR